MKPVVFAFAVLLFSSIAFGETHYESKYCEIFIDKAVAFQGSHSLRGVTFFVKTLNARLDGKVEEVGFHHRILDSAGGVRWDWHSEKLLPFMESDDYWALPLHFTSDWYDRRYEGVFYVRTDRDTTYWFRPAAGQNFVFDRNIYDIIMSRMDGTLSYEPRLDRAIRTQDPTLAYFNPDSCF